MEQIELDKKYLRMARIWAENSYCSRLKVGALIVKNKMIISDGYNGTPSGFENVCENVVADDLGNVIKTSKIETVEWAIENNRPIFTKSYVLHAEANAITKCAKSNNNCNGATLYVTDEPCLECSKLIIQSGILRVVFWRNYRDKSGSDLLKRAGISVEQVDISPNCHSCHEGGL